MQFKVDENLPMEFVSMLRAAGHGAVSVLEQGLGGEVDSEVAARCRAERRVIVTLDLVSPTSASIPRRSTVG
jgi:predicted nuclease of predicted toxin-antitoxin system